MPNLAASAPRCQVTHRSISFSRLAADQKTLRFSPFRVRSVIHENKNLTYLRIYIELPVGFHSRWIFHFVIFFLSSSFFWLLLLLLFVFFCFARSRLADSVYYLSIYVDMQEVIHLRTFRRRRPKSPREVREKRSSPLRTMMIMIMAVVGNH